MSRMHETGEKIQLPLGSFAFDITPSLRDIVKDVKVPE